LSDRKVCFDDYASRPTVEVPRHDAATGAALPRRWRHGQASFKSE
jgi:hypothetical protein